MAVNGRNKGKNGEREAIALLQPIVDSVYGDGVIELARNLTQTRGGGCDIEGLDWLALEVKRRESAFSLSWWQQTVHQAGPGQTPILMWRRNHQPWRFRVRTPVVTGGWQSGLLDVDMEREPFENYFVLMCHWHLTNSNR